jgi:hypothetical protein
MLSIRAVYFELPIVNTPGQVAIATEKTAGGSGSLRPIKRPVRVVSLG